MNGFKLVMLDRHFYQWIHVRFIVQKFFPVGEFFRYQLFAIGWRVDDFPAGAALEIGSLVIADVQFPVVFDGSAKTDRRLYRK